MDKTIKYIYFDILLSNHKSKLQQHNNIIKIHRIYYGDWKNSIVKYKIEKDKIVAE